MAKHYSLGIYDYDRQKICELYDSNVDLVGQAYDIQVTTEFAGYHTLQFNIPFMVDSKSLMGSDIASLYGDAIYGTNTFGATGTVNTKFRNYRWDFLRSDYLIRYSCDNKNIWFVASKPSKAKSSKKIYGTVTCTGFESLLKTRNIYMAFDDENGIGTIDYLMAQILRGTGWTYSPYRNPDQTRGLSDKMYEKDGTTEKVRSLSSDGKKGALDLIATTCNLFQARPVYDTDQKIVYVKAINNRDQVVEGEVGRNLTTLTIKHDSSNITTRVYIEGEYGDDGYVGIDDVKVDSSGNPDETGTAWGLPFMLNFDYYRELGVFKSSHETALSTYLTQIRAKKAAIHAKGIELTAAEDAVNEMIGQCKCVVYYKSVSLSTPIYNYGDCTAAQATLNNGDNVVILNSDLSTITYAQWSGDPTTQLANAYGVAKFVTPSAGKIGAAEVQIESKQKEIARLQRKINNLGQDDPKTAEYQAEIDRLNAEITSIYTGTDDVDGLYEMMQDTMKSTGLLYDVKTIEGQIETLNGEQDEIEATFIVAMGYMLRDGYWSNQNYVIGQEEFLYRDAQDMTKEMSRPTTDISIGYVRLTEDYDIQPEDIQMNAIFKIWDEDLEVYENMFVKKISYGVDNKELGGIEVSNQDITLTGNDLSTLLSRMSQLSDLIEQKNALYERAKAISQSGTLFADRLNGQIDVVKNQILSSVSNWYTDDRGNIVFISADESSAMMLSGAGFMLASGKDDSGEWNWRCLGTGEGITADEIIAGFISAERIEAHTITVNHLTSGIESELNLTSNTALTTYVQSTADAAAAAAKLTPTEFDVMFSTSNSKSTLEGEIGGVQTNLDNYAAGVSVYMRYDNTGTLELGKSDSPLKTQITNSRMSFLDNGNEVAYISNQSMYITQARVTETLSIGTNNGYGYFDWVVTPTGLGLKWRGT